MLRIQTAVFRRKAAVICPASAVLRIWTAKFRSAGAVFRGISAMLRTKIAVLRSSRAKDDSDFAVAHTFSKPKQRSVSCCLEHAPIAFTKEDGEDAVPPEGGRPRPPSQIQMVQALF